MRELNFRIFAACNIGYLPSGLQRTPLNKGPFAVIKNTKLAYTVPQACDASGIGRTHLYKLVSEGLLEARRCGGRTLIPAASLSAYIANLPPAPIRAKEVA